MSARTTLRFLAIILAAVAILAIGAGLVASGTKAPDPAPESVTTEVTTPIGMCPTEDSCTIDYHDGAWHIVRATP